MSTFHGNIKLKQKATYEGICLHLQDVISLVALLCNYVFQEIRGECLLKGTRMQLKLLAGVVGRNILKFNPDAFWSATFYKGLHTIQYEDGRDILNNN